MKKRLLSLLCALILILGAVPSAAALEGETRRAAQTLTSLHLLDKVPTAKELKTNVNWLQASTLLTRLGGSGSTAPLEYIVAKGWVSTAGDAQEDIPTNDFCAALLRQLGYAVPAGEDAAVLLARRIGLTIQDYDETLTQGDLYQLVRDALVFPDTEGTTLAQRLVNQKTCTQAQIQPLFPEELTARQIADRHIAAVFRLDTYYSEKSYQKDENDNGGSGFFISADGLAVTNYHTIDGAIKASANLVTGEVFDVEKVLFYDSDADIALLRVSKTTRDGTTSTPHFAYFEIAEEPEVRPGDRVYTMGVPLGITLTISDGIISATNHVVKNYSLPCIVNTASISHGSSGGVLLNVYGHVVGVTTGAYASGNNLYISVPLTPVLEADWTILGYTLEKVQKDMQAKKASER